MVKDTWTKPPVGWLTRPVGAVPVNRSKATGMVAQMVDEFDRQDDFHLIIPPEGTRSRADTWKSGFYRIARAADVPIVPAFLDYSTRRGGFGPAIEMTGDAVHDMDMIRAYYGDAGHMARYTDKFGPIAIRDEEAEPPAT
jgi:1-acyl-sn-glycerol-3-phosphate acyltransferase